LASLIRAFATLRSLSDFLPVDFSMRVAWLPEIVFEEFRDELHDANSVMAARSDM
jgi:hypothetical protein